MTVKVVQSELDAELDKQEPRSRSSKTLPPKVSKAMTEGAKTAGYNLATAGYRTFSNALRGGMSDGPVMPSQVGLGGRPGRKGPIGHTQHHLHHHLSEMIAGMFGTAHKEDDAQNQMDQRVQQKADQGQIQDPLLNALNAWQARRAAKAAKQAAAAAPDESVMPAEQAGQATAQSGEIAGNSAAQPDRQQDESLAASVRIPPPSESYPYQYPDSRPEARFSHEHEAGSPGKNKGDDEPSLWLG